MKVTGIERPFGGEIRAFDLSPIGAWRAVESKCGVGIGKVFGRLWSCMATGIEGRANPSGFEFHGDDLREVLLQGLKGGGMADGDATRLIRETFDTQPAKGQWAPLAIEIVSAWWFGLPEGKSQAPEMKDEAATAQPASTSALSTGPAQS